jgi:hypothetical protein
MSQYTFSYLNSEYERVPYQLKKTLDEALATSAADPAVKELIGQVCTAVEEAVSDLALYAKDQLHL